MKKIFAAVFSMALVFGLVGCAAQSDEASSGSQQVEGLTDEESTARARELMEQLIAAPTPTNVTEVNAVKTTTQSDGEDYSNTVTTTTLRDTSGGAARFMITTQSDPAADSDATYYVDGTDGVLEVEDERASLTYDQSYIDSLLNPEDGSDTYRTFFDCASQISYYQDANGAEIVRIDIDPAKLMESGLLSATFSSIESCSAEYTFDREGQLTTSISTVKGDLINTDGENVPATVETKSLFTDYGVTNVPALPEVEDTEAAADQQMDEAQSGE